MVDQAAGDEAGEAERADDGVAARMTDSKRKDTPVTADLAGLRHNSRLTITRYGSLSTFGGR